MRATAGHMRRAWELVLLAGLAVFAAACTTTPGAPVLERVSPNRISNSGPIDLAIHGQAFEVGLQVRFDEATLAVDDGFQVGLSPTTMGGDTPTSLDQVRWLSATELAAQVPAGLSPGVWDVTVKTPGGGVATLVAGLEVFEESPACRVDADCLDTDPCTINERCEASACLSDPLERRPLYRDLDGDGFGDPRQSQQSCVPIDGYVGRGDDCDDDPSGCGGDCSPDKEGDRCDGFDNDCDGSLDEDVPRVTWFQDADNDGFGSDIATVQACVAPAGYVESGGDCDDAPGACGAKCGPVADRLDRCDGFDNDCDGDVDEDPESTVWYRDLDGDGDGDPQTTVNGCAQPPGFVATAGDCDDDPALCGADCGPAVAQEVCDGFDNNCDGDVDEGLATTWYRDADDDGAGDAADSQESCAQPPGYVATAGDCDDDPAVCGAACSPGNSADPCDGFDNNCSGAVDEDDPPALWYADSDGDGFGVATLTVTACEAPTGFVATAGDCDDDPTGCGELCNSSISNDICDGFDNDCDPNTVDGSSEPDFGAACDGPDSDLCADGFMKCGGGVMVCSDNAASTSESETAKTCSDGIDNDCDGDTDALDSECIVVQVKPDDLSNKSSTLHSSSGDRTTHGGSTHRFSGLEPFSVGLWCQRTQGSFVAQTIVAAREEGTSALRGWWLTWKSGGNGYIEMTMQAGNDDLMASRTDNGEAPSDEDWHFVVATYDGSGTAAGIQIFVDGVQAATSSTSDSFTGPLASDLELSWGAWGDLWLGQWIGNIDETSLWSVALTAADIAMLFNDGTPVSPLAATDSAALLSWWRHGDQNGGDNTVMVDQVGDNHGVLDDGVSFVANPPGNPQP